LWEQVDDGKWKITLGGKKLTKWHVNTMIKNVDGNKEDIKWRYGSMEKWTYVCVECGYGMSLQKCFGKTLKPTIQQEIL